MGMHSPAVDVIDKAKTGGSLAVRCDRVLFVVVGGWVGVGGGGHTSAILVAVARRPLRHDSGFLVTCVKQTQMVGLLVRTTRHGPGGLRAGGCGSHSTCMSAASLSTQTAHRTHSLSFLLHAHKDPRQQLQVPIFNHCHRDTQLLLVMAPGSCSKALRKGNASLRPSACCRSSRALTFFAFLHFWARAFVHCWARAGVAVAVWARIALAHCFELIVDELGDQRNPALHTRATHHHRPHAHSTGLECSFVSDDASDTHKKRWAEYVCGIGSTLLASPTLPSLSRLATQRVFEVLAERRERAGGWGWWAQHNVKDARVEAPRSSVFGHKFTPQPKPTPAARKDTVGAGAHRLEGGCKKDKAVRTVQSRPAQEPRKAAGSSSSSRAPQGVRVKHTKKKCGCSMIILIVCERAKRTSPQVVPTLSRARAAESLLGDVGLASTPCRKTAYW
jgi:hypothetical protein